MEDQIEISSDDEFDLDKDFDLPLGERLGLERSGVGAVARTFTHSGQEDGNISAAKVLERNSSIAIIPPPPSTPFAAHSSRSESDLPDKEELVLGPPSSGGAARTGKVWREDKENHRQRRLLEKQEKRKQKEKEKKNSKAAKEAEKLVSKQIDKTEVHKYLGVIVDPALVSAPPGSEILNLLQNPPSGKAEHVFQFRVEPLPAPCCLVWRRKVVSYSADNGDVDIQEHTQEEGRALVLLSAEALIEKIDDKSLERWAFDTKKKLGGKHITLMVYNYNEYFKQEKNARQRIQTAGVRGEVPRGRDLARLKEAVTKYEAEEALVSLSLDGLADHLTFDKSAGKGWKELAGAVFHQTRAVAEAPLKLKKGLTGSAGFNFWATADSKNCVDSKNLAEYWKQVLMQVSSGAGLEKVTAIVSRYPSPGLLLAAYEGCGSVREAQDLVAGLEVRRTDNVLGGTRRVGPDISRRIHTALTTLDADKLLSSK